MADFQKLLSDIINNATEQSASVRNSFDAHYSLDRDTGSNMVFIAFDKKVLKHRKEDVVSTMQFTFQSFLSYLAQNPERPSIVEAHADGIQSLIFEAYDWLKDNSSGFIFCEVTCKPPEVYGLEHFMIRGYFSERITDMPTTLEGFAFIQGFRFDNAIIPMDLTKYKG